MANREVKEAAAAIRKRTDDAIRSQQRPKRYAAITRINPLTAELTDGNLVLDEDDLVLSQWVEQYRKQYGLKIGEALTVHRMGNGDWVADDVISTRRVRRLRTKPRKKATKGKHVHLGPLTVEAETPDEVSIDDEAEIDDEQSPEEGSEDLEATEEVEDLEDEEEENELPLDELKGFAAHGTTTTFTRPTAASVEWNGSVEPVNAVDNDTWINPPSE